MAYKILVVEDEEPVRQNLVELLEAEGYECVEARDGEEGVAAAIDEIPDLIICDVLMPQLDGFGVLARLSQDDATAAIPFVFLTARVERSDQRMGMDLGADDYVTKPFSRTDILNAVEKRLKKRVDVLNHTRRAVQDLRDRMALQLPETFLTPLSLILNSAESLRRISESRGDTEHVKQAADVIERAAHELLESIGNTMLYIDLELIETDRDRKMEYSQIETANAGLEIKAISQMVARKYDREADLYVDVVDSRVKIAAEHLHKLMEEVLDNAFHFSSSGSPVHITGRLQEPDIYRLRIHDAGQGMYPEQVANMVHMSSFDRRRFIETHTGLGWMIVRKIIDLCGGRVSIQSRLGEGTLIEFELPVDRS